MGGKAMGGAVAGPIVTVEAERARLRAMVISLAVSVVLLAAK